MSTVKANDLMKVDGGVPTVKGQQLIPTAWVNFNGNNTVSIRGSENVSSITDSGTGTYVVNFASAMSTVNYCIHGNQGASTIGTMAVNEDHNHTTSTGKVGIRRSDNQALMDSSSVFISVLGGQS